MKGVVVVSIEPFCGKAHVCWRMVVSSSLVFATLSPVFAISVLSWRCVFDSVFLNMFSLFCWFAGSVEDCVGRRNICEQKKQWKRTRQAQIPVQTPFENNSTKAAAVTSWYFWVISKVVTGLLPLFPNIKSDLDGPPVLQSKSGELQGRGEVEVSLWEWKSVPLADRHCAVA